MTQKAPIKDLVDYLIHRGKVEVPAHGSRILVEFSARTELLSFQSTVYQGQDYVPPSVRLCLSPSFRGPASSLLTSLELHKETYSVSLHFSDTIPHLTHDLLMSLLEEFGWLAEEWRQVFDDHDKRDLVHIRAKI